MGGPNAGFTSLAAAMDYLQAHPAETVWAMNWDSPSYPPKEDQLNENIVLLVLAGPTYKTGRDPLAWIGRPVDNETVTFKAKERNPAVINAWQATLASAAANAGKTVPDIGYVIHDANIRHPDSNDRMRHLAHVLVLDVPLFDYTKQTFNTPGLLGEMGAGTALTNVALGIAYANHFRQERAGSRHHRPGARHGGVDHAASHSAADRRRQTLVPRARRKPRLPDVVGHPP